jgi:hypothetical protein
MIGARAMLLLNNGDSRRAYFIVAQCVQPDVAFARSALRLLPVKIKI